MKIKYRIREDPRPLKPSAVFDIFDQKHGVVTDQATRSRFVAAMITASLSLKNTGEVGNHCSQAKLELATYYKNLNPNIPLMGIIKEIYEPIWKPLETAINRAKNK